MFGKEIAWALIPAAALVLAGADETNADRVVLRGGSRIDAPVLKQNEKIIVLDLGFNVLSIPRDEVLTIRKQENDDAPIDDDQTRLYSMTHTERLSTVTAARRYAPAVVVVRTPQGLGSGFFVNNEGYLITNFHVIKGEKHISVTRFSEQKNMMERILHKDVDIVATAPFHDLAVLRVNDLDEDITPVVFNPEDDPPIGARVFTIGNPLGLERSVTEGVVSQTARNFRGMLFLQIDAPVNPGNSGGPLFNDRGQVIGVINMTVPTMEGLNFAIPAMHARYLLDHIEAFAFDESNPETGFVYPDPPPRPGKFLDQPTKTTNNDKENM